MSSEAHGAGWSTRVIAGRIGALLAAAFALTNIYWALGGTIGLSSLGGEIEQRARSGDQALEIANWLAVAAKLGGALFFLALVERAGRRVPRRVLIPIGWFAGCLLIAYGALQMIGVAVIATNNYLDGEPILTTALIWRLLLWEPWFLALGVLLIVTLRGVPRRRDQYIASPKA